MGKSTATVTTPDAGAAVESTESTDPIVESTVDSIASTDAPTDAPTADAPDLSSESDDAVESDPIGDLNDAISTYLDDGAGADADDSPIIDAARALLVGRGYVVKVATTAQRATLAKADPTAVGAYFASTGLSRKELADALGLTVSVIATVQNPNGDRWSQTRFELAKRGIDAYVVAKAALDAERAAEAAAAEAKADAA